MSLFYRFLYRPLMRFAHRFNWHYAPIIGPIDPGGVYQRWCKWCGFRDWYIRESEIMDPPGGEG